MQEDYTMKDINNTLKENFATSVMDCCSFYRLSELEFNECLKALKKSLKTLRATGEDSSYNVHLQGFESNLELSVTKSHVDSLINLLDKCSIERLCLEGEIDTDVENVYKDKLAELTLIYVTYKYYQVNLKNLTNISDKWGFDSQIIINYLTKRAV
jgi:hypothetical protein